MPDLKNNFCWSFSQAKDFAACKRRHYWNRYGFWGGWDSMAPLQARTAYRLKRMSNKWSLIGDAVDAAVTEVVERAVVGADVSLEKALEKATRKLREAWKEHHSKKWMTSPKKYTCIRELYYEEIPSEPSTDRDSWVDSVKERTEGSLRNFFLHVLPRLEGIKGTDLMPIARAEHGDPEHFHIGQIKVYAIPDCAYRRHDSVIIHDWKTGVRRDEHEKQIAVYGVWAQKKHEQPARKIELLVEYLQSGETRPVPYDESVGRTTSDFILSSVKEMREYIKGGDVALNEPKDIEEFPKTENLTECCQCNFRELCNREYAIHGD